MKQSGRIQLLDDTSINKIAAGEVIDRPSSVVKELVENSLDAGAKRIEVSIRDGGLGKIVVRDDGGGMLEQDVRMAVLRHATSKIRSADELDSIVSLGFRGEALPSIASVSRFQIISRPASEDFGTCLEIQGGQLADVRECGSEIGTTVQVADLFYNTPARLKFMKTPASESAHVHEAMVRLALSRPDVTFRVTNNDRTTLHTPGTGLLADTLTALYGPDTVRQLFTLDSLDGGIRIRGFAARPSVRKGSRQWQSFIVNGRVIGSRMLNRAVDTAYQTLLPPGSYPLVVLLVELPASDLDVNVHPQKAEIKFQDERSVFRAVHAALRDALSVPDRPSAAAAPFEPERYRSVSYVQESLPVEGAYHAPESSDTSPEAAELREQSGSPCVPSAPAHPVAAAVAAETALTALAQYARCYILATDGDSLYIVDQHAAHERLLFDLLARRQSSRSFQTLLIPLSLALDPLERQAAETYGAELAALGFGFDWLGPDAVRISELPAHIPQPEAETLFRQILTSSLALKAPDPEAFRQAWIETAACHLAVRAGQPLNRQEMQGLLDDLMRAERPFTCPHGRPTLIRMTGNDLARMFRRI